MPRCHLLTQEFHSCFSYNIDKSRCHKYWREMQLTPPPFSFSTDLEESQNSSLAMIGGGGRPFLPPPGYAIDLLQAQSRHIHLLSWKKSSWTNLSLRIYPCVNILMYICNASYNNKITSQQNAKIQTYLLLLCSIRYIQKCLNMDKSLMTGLSKNIFP